MSLFVSGSGLSPGSRKAKVQWAKVYLICMESSVARSSYWLLPVGRYLSDSRCKGSVVIRFSQGELRAMWLIRAADVTTSFSYQVRKRRTMSGSSDLRI